MHSRLRASFFLLGLTIALCGCATSRPKLTEQELLDMRTQTLEQIRTDQVLAAGKFVRRMKTEQDEYEAARARGENPPEPVFNVLVISGGGDWGAFGSGLLKGWGSVTGDRARPEFDIVTGVSTGALIAPFAFLGTEKDYEAICELYRNPKQDWVEVKDWLFFLPWRESFTTTKGLRRDVEVAFNKEAIARAGEASLQDRSLIVGTTNLDFGVNRPFPLGEICERATISGDDSLVYNVLMASSAVPAAFPPQVIDGQLYVDGGTTANMLAGANIRSEKSLVGLWKKMYPDRKMSKIRIWVVINNQMSDVPKVVSPTWPSITGASLTTMSRFSNIASMRLLDFQTELMRKVDGIDVQYFYVAVPDDFRVPVQGTFKQETMRALSDLGYKMGLEPESWKTSLAFE
ncbi:MAG: patatin-like phospholipase family protein [Planctomycetes bacterium]|nr:patatin-like phospholipase family protein [Planctomycetota bacterium]